MRMPFINTYIECCVRACVLCVREFIYILYNFFIIIIFSELVYACGVCVCVVCANVFLYFGRGTSNFDWRVKTSCASKCHPYFFNFFKLVYVSGVCHIRACACS